jgi:hypothetical protein
VLLHMEHYRSRSAAFAGRCAEYFNADQIVAQFLNVASNIHGTRADNVARA